MVNLYDCFVLSTWPINYRTLKEFSKWWLDVYVSRNDDYWAIIYLLYLVLKTLKNTNQQLVGKKVMGTGAIKAHSEDNQKRPKNATAFTHVCTMSNLLL